MRNTILQPENLNERGHFVDLRVEGRLILGRIILKQGVGWIFVALMRYQYWATVSKVMNLRAQLVEPLLHSVGL